MALRDCNHAQRPERFESQVAPGALASLNCQPIIWVAVKEFTLNYHSMDIYK